MQKGANIGFDARRFWSGNKPGTTESIDFSAAVRLFSLSPPQPASVAARRRSGGTVVTLAAVCARRAPVLSGSIRSSATRQEADQQQL